MRARRGKRDAAGQAGGVRPAGPRARRAVAAPDGEDGNAGVAGNAAPASRAARQPTALEAAITMLGYRALPEKKLREKLAPRFDEAAVDAAVERLRELRLVDDEAWASRFAEQRSARAGRGRHRIRAELLARGIDADAVDTALAALPAGDEERERAAAVLESMRRRLSGASRAASRTPAEAEARDRERLFRRMIARGWPAGLVRDLLGNS